MKYLVRVIDSYVHDGRIGVLVEIGGQSEFTLRLEEVARFMKDMAVHIAATSPNDVDELLSQEFVKEPSKTIQACQAELSAKLREAVGITRFVRWDVELAPPEPDSPPHDPATAARLKVVQ